MITRIAAKNYRSLRHISRTIKPFQILVGPNASGKTTFLDVVKLMGDVVQLGVDKAVRSRTDNFYDLTFARKGGPIELAVECAIPESIRTKLNGNGSMDALRYELHLDELEREGLSIVGERLILLNSGAARTNQPERTLFPELLAEEEVFGKAYKSKGGVSPYRLVVSKSKSDTFKPEKPRQKWVMSFRFGPKKSALANLPEDEDKFPVSTWFKSFITTDVQRLMLNSERLRASSPPGIERTYLPDGSNLPWVVEELMKRHPVVFGQWIKHVRTALPDLKAISVGERPDLRTRFLWLEYDNGIKVPSWTASDGTLRLLALTLIRYLPDTAGAYLIEEPENGIHPKAVETVYKSLSSSKQDQVLVASHSTVVLSLAEPKDLLCFAKTAEGVTDIVAGEEHPSLASWRKGSNLSLLFASGILG